MVIGLAVKSSAVRCPNCQHELALVDVNASAANDAAACETLDDWVQRFRATRRVARPDDEQRTYELWIQPALGSRAVAAITRAEIETWVEQMDRRVVAGELRWGTATRIWGLLSIMLQEASSSKVRALRVRPDNPAADVRPPDREASRASTFLYPSELVRLARCGDVPIGFRRLYAVAVYLYPRAGELRALDWSDIDLATARVHVHRSQGRDGETGRTKTDADRQFVAERTLLPLLRVMRREVDGAGLLFPRINQRQNLARALRGHLLLAGCDRADLHADDDGRRPLSFHDLRATGITWQAMRGDAPTDIMERVGHTQIATTQRYIRRGRLLVARRETVFPRLPDELLRKK